MATNKSPGINSAPIKDLSVYHTFTHTAIRYKNNLVRLRRNADSYADTKNLIEQLINELCSDANKIIMQVNNWTKDVEEQVRLFDDEVATNIKELNAKIIKAQNDIQRWWDDTSFIVSKCIELHSSEAKTFLNDVEKYIKQCIDNEVNTIKELFELLEESSTIVLKAAKTIFSEMEFCSQEKSYDITSVGRCLARVLVKNKKRMNLLGEFGRLVARTSLAVLVFPDELQTCLVSPLMNAGLKIGEVVVDISACSINSFLEEMFRDS